MNCVLLLLLFASVAVHRTLYTYKIYPLCRTIFKRVCVFTLMMLLIIITGAPARMELHANTSWLHTQHMIIVTMAVFEYEYQKLLHTLAIHTQQQQQQNERGNQVYNKTISFCEEPKQFSLNFHFAQICCQRVADYLLMWRNSLDGRI